jgi:phage portal protein BeeE
MSHLLLWGNAYAQILRNGKGEITALYPLMPNQMEVDRASNGQIYYCYTKNSDDSFKSNNAQSGRQYYLKPSEILHIPGLGFDGLIGYSPISMATIETGGTPNPGQSEWRCRAKNTELNFSPTVRTREGC